MMIPIEILSELIRFDTTNPPGGEKACILWIQSLLEGSGFKTSLYSKDPERPNLVTRLKGRADAPPLLLYGHVDVVPAEEKNWQHSPFQGIRNDGFLWGRGALDMKGGIAMMLSALLRIASGVTPPAGDIVFCALSDEEGGGDFGAGFMVSEYPGLFSGINYAIGEFGGFPLYIGNRCFYLIQTGEKQVCWMKALLKGPSGHGAQRMTGGAAGKLGSLLTTLDKKRLPVHITPIVSDMIHKMASELPFPAAILLKSLLNPVLTDTVLRVLGEQGSLFDPVLHNTVNATVFRGGNKINVIPSEISIELDGRVLPGFSSDDLVREIKTLSGLPLEIEIIRNDPAPSHPDMGLFDTLSGVLKELHPGSVPVPFLLPGITDARYFSRLGIQTYGYLPMNLPKGFKFPTLIHAANERIPESCLDFGVDALVSAIMRYGID